MRIKRYGSISSQKYLYILMLYIGLFTMSLSKNDKCAEYKGKSYDNYCDINDKK